MFSKVWLRFLEMLIFCQLWPFKSIKIDQKSKKSHNFDLTPSKRRTNQNLKKASFNVWNILVAACIANFSILRQFFKEKIDLAANLLFFRFSRFYLYFKICSLHKCSSQLRRFEQSMTTFLKQERYAFNIYQNEVYSTWSLLVVHISLSVCVCPSVIFFFKNGF